MAFPDMESIDLSICVVTYKSRDNLDALLLTIERANLPLSFEVLVVDNASNDGIREALNEKHPHVALVENPSNRFYTAAQNQNLSRARGRFVLIVNPDIRLEQEALPRMISYLNEHPEVGAVCPKFLREDGTQRVPVGRFLTFKWGLFEIGAVNCIWPGNRENARIMGDQVWFDPERNYEAEVLYGACILTRREVLEAVGMLDEELVHGWDEYDWCKRVANANYKLCYVPAAVVTHLEGSSRKVFDQESVMVKFHYDGIFYYFRKHHGMMAWMLLRFVFRFIRPRVFRYGPIFK